MNYTSKNSNSPSDSSLPNITACDLAIVMEWTRVESLKFVLMNGTITPNLDKPSHTPIYSGLFSMKRATTSPFLYPWLLNTLAILLLYSSNYKNEKFGSKFKKTLFKPIDNVKTLHT